jgi:hypothetical protein
MSRIEHKQVGPALQFTCYVLDRNCRTNILRLSGRLCCSHTLLKQLLALPHVVCLCSDVCLTAFAASLDSTYDTQEFE